MHLANAFASGEMQVIIDTDSMKSVGLAASAVAGFFVVVVRPRIPAKDWARLGNVGYWIDALICGNSGSCKNAMPVDEQDRDVPMPKG